MPERGSFCPMCGKDNAVQELFQQEETATVLPEAKKMKRTAAICGCVAVMVVLGLLLFFGIRGGLFNPNANPTNDTRPTDGTQATVGTIPADGNSNDATCKGSYTVTDAQAQTSRDVVVATVGGHELTNSQLQIYYQMEVLEFVNQYGYYLSFIGLDYTQPLDQQPCMMLDGYTWQQYFLKCALSTWHSAQALAIEAGKNQFQMESTYQQQLDNLDSNMATQALMYGFESADAFLQAQCGSNTTMADYKQYMNVYYTGFLYYGQLADAIEEPTDAEVEAYFQANKEKLESQGIKQDGSYLVDVRHILIMVEGGTESEDGTITFPDEAVATQARQRAETILQQWLENPTEEYFGQLAKEHTADGNGDAGGLYTGVYPGQMVASFNDWCFDTSRQPGDYGIVETRFGYHIMYFSARGEDTWLSNTRKAYLSQMEEDILTNIIETYDLDVSYDKIELVHVAIG